MYDTKKGDGNGGKWLVFLSALLEESRPITFDLACPARRDDAWIKRLILYLHK